MHLVTAQKRLSEWSRKGRQVFLRRDLRRIFPEDNEAAFDGGLHRLTASGLLVRAARGVFVYGFSDQPKPYLLEEIAVALRRGEYAYLSLESALSEYGIISQVPIDRITVMTTGRKREFQTPYGVIEFIHTDRDVETILDGTRDVGRPLPLATPERALGDLRRVGRNTHLIDLEIADVRSPSP